MNKKISNNYKRVLFATSAIAFAMLLCLNLTSAIYAGESKYYDFQDKVDNVVDIDYDIINNVGNIDFEIITNDTGVIISINKYSPPGEFEIRFKINGKETLKIDSNDDSSKYVAYSTKDTTKGIYNTNDKEIKDYIQNTNETIVVSEEVDKKGGLSKTWKIIKYILLGLLVVILIYELFFRKSKKLKEEDYSNEKDNVEGTSETKVDKKVEDDIGYLLEDIEEGEELKGGDTTDGNKKYFEEFKE